MSKRKTKETSPSSTKRHMSTEVVINIYPSNTDPSNSDSLNDSSAATHAFVEYSKMEPKDPEVSVNMWCDYDKKDTIKVVIQEESKIKTLFKTGDVTLETAEVKNTMIDDTREINNESNDTVECKAFTRQSHVDPLLLEHMVLNHNQFERLIWSTILSYARPIVALTDPKIIHQVFKCIPLMIQKTRDSSSTANGKTKFNDILIECSGLGKKFNFYITATIDYALCKGVLRNVNDTMNYFTVNPSPNTYPIHDGIAILNLYNTMYSTPGVIMDDIYILSQTSGLPYYSVVYIVDFIKGIRDPTKEPGYDSRTPTSLSEIMTQFCGQYVSQYLDKKLIKFKFVRHYDYQNVTWTYIRHELWEKKKYLDTVSSRVKLNVIIEGACFYDPINTYIESIIDDPLKIHLNIIGQSLTITGGVELSINNSISAYQCRYFDSTLTDPSSNTRWRKWSDDLAYRNLS